MALKRENVRGLVDQARKLWAEWDPIGVMEIPEAHDEYDAYLGSTISLLDRGATLDEIEAFLADITLRRMGLTDNPIAASSRQQFAARLRAWYDALP